MKAVAAQPHEFAANYLYGSHDLDPFFAFDAVVKEGGGSASGEFNDQGERWHARLSYQTSNIVNPGETTPAGTPFEVETIREFRLKVYRAPSQDDTGEQDFTAHIAPRWTGMQGEKNDGSRVSIPVPDGFEGVNARVTGSNIAFERYPALLRMGAAAVSVSSRYFETPDRMSNVQDAAIYVRLHRDDSGPVHARDGPIASLGHLMESDRQGYRKVVQNDDDDHGRNVAGYYHTVTLGPEHIREAFPSHSRPKEVKHYYARRAADFDEKNPLAHPKVEVAYQVKRWNETQRADPDALAQLREELEETLYAVLAEAGLQTWPGEDGGRPFVEDPYFDLAEIGRKGEWSPVSLDLTHIREEQESIVVRHLADGLSPVQWESLQTLVTDGGEVSPEGIASEHERHPDSVRRALRGMEDLVHREYARVSLRSDYVAELVHDAVKEARDATRRAVEAGAKAIEAAERGLDETMSAFVAWAARYGIDVHDRREARMTLRFGEKPAYKERRDAIRRGFRVWIDAGMSAEEFRTARVEFPQGGSAKAWRYLTG